MDGIILQNFGTKIVCKSYVTKIPYLCTRFKLESGLGFFQIISLLTLDISLDEEKRTCYDGQYATHSCHYERPAEKVIRVSRHPAFGVPKAAKYNYRQCAAYTTHQQQTSNYRDKLHVSFLFWIAAQSEQQYQSERHEAQ